MNALVPAAGLVPENMDQAIRLATAMSKARLVPKHLQDDAGSCLMVVEQAMRWQMSPFAVAQCTSVIGGKLMYEGKLVAAACESVGAIEGGFSYTFTGEGDGRTVTVSARRRGEKEPRTMDVRLGDVKTDNQFWKKQPDQQLVYSGARNWTRRWAPAVLLGVYAPEEFGKPVDDFSGVTIDVERHTPDARDALNSEIPVTRAVAADLPRAPTLTEKPPTKQRARSYREIIDSLRMAFRDATTHEEVDRILCGVDVAHGRANFKDAALAELEQLVADVTAKWWPENADASHEPEGVA